MSDAQVYEMRRKPVVLMEITDDEFARFAMLYLAWEANPRAINERLTLQSACREEWAKIAKSMQRKLLIGAVQALTVETLEARAAARGDDFTTAGVRMVEPGGTWGVGVLLWSETRWRDVAVTIGLPVPMPYELRPAFLPQFKAATVAEIRRQYGVA